MQSESPWFSHDANARNNAKLRTLRGKFGAEGYGWFWIIMEMLRERTDRSLDLSRPYLKIDAATELGTTPERLIEFIEFGTRICFLFHFESEQLTCPGLFERLRDLDEHRAALSVKRSAAGKAGADARWGQKNTEEMASNGSDLANANSKIANDALREQNRTEQSITEKEKKSRVSVIYSVPPLLREVSEYAEGIQRGEIPISPPHLKNIAAECVNPFYDHFASNGWKVGGKTKMKDWQASFRGWLRRSGEFKPNGHAVQQSSTGPLRVQL